MYLMYVDESGDPGAISPSSDPGKTGNETMSPAQYFILSGLVIHEIGWKDCLTRIHEFRKRMAVRFGLRIREEIHASHFISRPGELRRIRRNDRLAILRHFVDEMAQMPDVRAIHVLVDKSSHPGQDVFEMAWRALIQRFENTMSHGNFPGPRHPGEKGMLFPDQTDTKKLRLLLRRMRYYNQIPNRMEFGMGSRNVPLRYVIEDPNWRTSHDSYFIQMVDTMAWLCLQYHKPCAYMRTTGGHKYFERLEPILCKVASLKDPWGIVRL